VIIRLIGHSLPEGLFEDWIQAIGIYVMTVNKDIDQQQYQQALAGILPTQFEPGSLADRLLIQGREEGREEGELIGKIQMLEELLGEPTTPKGQLIALGKDALMTKLAGLQQRVRDRQVGH